MVWLTRWLMIFGLLLSFHQASAVDFSKKKIKIGKVVLNVEVAETDEQHQQGLMYREKLAPNAGMIFVFNDEEPRFFWMKNTYVDLSIGFFDKNRKLIDIQDMKATTVMQKEFPNYPSRGPAQYALEVSKGWFKKNGIREGAIFNWD